MSKTDNLTELFRQLITLAAQLLRALLILLLLLSVALLRLLAVAVQALHGVAGASVRLACVAICALCVVSSVGPLWTSFGGDLPALIPVGVILITPLAESLRQRAGFGGLVIAGLIIVGAAAALSALPVLVRALVVVCVLAASIVEHQTQIHLKEKKHEQLL